MLLLICFAFYNYKNVTLWVKHGGNKTTVDDDQNTYVYRSIYNDHEQFKTLLILDIKAR